MKKLLSVILIITVILSLGACGKGKNKLTLLAETEKSDSLMLSVDFFLPSLSGIKIEGDKKNYPYRRDLEIEKENCNIYLALHEDADFAIAKEYNKNNDESYKEFKIGNYDCFGYADFNGYFINVLLEKVDDKTYRYLEICMEVLDYRKEHRTGIEYYEDEDIKEIANSFVYNGLVNAKDAKKELKR